MKMKKVIALIMVALICVMTFAVTASASDDKPASSTTATSARAETPTGEAKWRVKNKVYYGTINEAFEALAKTGGTIDLLADAPLTMFLMLNADVSVNGDHTLYIEGYAYVFEGITVTLNCNVCVNGEAENAGTVYIKCVADKTLNGEFKGNEPLELHHWNSGSIDKEPTYDEEGAIRYICFDCFAVKFDSLPKLVKKSTRDIITLVLALSVAGIAVICIAGITCTEICKRKRPDTAAAQGEEKE